MAKRNEPHNQQMMFDTDRPATRDSGPVTCLGITFPNDEARREHFLGLLRTGLHELREKLSVPLTNLEDTCSRLKSLEHWPLGTDEQIRDLAQRIARAASSTRDSGPATRDLLGLYKDEVGFPIGSDEDIPALSDPPYYTACPNPFIADFIKPKSAGSFSKRRDRSPDGEVNPFRFPVPRFFLLFGRLKLFSPFCG
jgi:hypothetical protein